MVDPGGRPRGLVAAAKKFDVLQAGNPQRGHARLRVGADGVCGQPPLERNLDYHSGEVVCAMEMSSIRPMLSPKYFTDAPLFRPLMGMSVNSM